MKRVSVALLAALVLVLVAPPAYAGPEATSVTPAQATEGAALKESADELVRAKRYEEALAVYDKAYALTHDPALLYNRGRALEYLARYPEALAAIESFARDASPELRAKVPGLTGKLDELRSKTTRLTLRCPVPGARVVLGDRILGTTPLAAPIIVTAGRLSLEVSAEGYFTSQRALELPGGGDVSIDVELASKTRTALVLVKSPVAGSSVSLDGKSAGAAPAELVVAPGEHEITVDAEGHRAVQSRLVLAAGDRREVTLAPTKRSLTSTWWFWTGIGVVVAGAAIGTGIALTTEKDPTAGDRFSPPNVRAP